MKKLFTICFSLLLTFNISAQDACEKGSLLLEGNLSGVAFNSLTGSPAFGIYFSDRFALTMNSRVGLIDDETNNLSLGARIHFTESQLLKVDIAFNGEAEEISVGLGIANRFYLKDWLSFQPQVGVYYVGESLFMAGGVGFNIHVSKY